MKRYWPYWTVAVAPVPFGVQAGAWLLSGVWLASASVIGALMVRADRDTVARNADYPYTHPDKAAVQPDDTAELPPVKVAVPERGNDDAEA